MDGVVEGAENIMETIGETIEDWDVIEWGKDMIDNFIEGIKDRIWAVKDAVGDVASAVKDVLGFSEPDEGPLSNFHTFAPDMMNLFAKGIRDNMGLVTDAIDETAATIQTGFEITPSSSYAVSTASGDTTNRLEAILEMLEEYMPSFVTASDMENMTLSVDDREFGRLVHEVV